MAKCHSIELPSHDYLARLARVDPECFECLRCELIKEVIDGAPERMKPRLRGLQFQIDCERQLSRSALGMTVRLHNLMWQSFLQLNDRMQDLVNRESNSFSSQGSSSQAGSASRQSARIIEFSRRSQNNRQ